MRNPIQLIKDALALYKGNPVLLLGIVVVPLTFSYLLELMSPAAFPMSVSNTELLLYAGLFLTSIILSILMAVALIYAVNDTSLSISSAYKQAFGKFWQYLGLSILTTVILFIGFLLLIVPGIIMAVWFSFATFVLVLEGKGIIDSLKTSRSYVRGKWWGVFGRIIAGTILMMLLMMIVVFPSALFFGEMISDMLAVALTIILSPIAVGYMYLMYQDVKGGGDAAVSASMADVPPATPNESAVASMTPASATIPSSETAGESTSTQPGQ